MTDSGPATTATPQPDLRPGGGVAAAGLRASRQRHLLVLLLFLHTVNTYMDRVCISAAKSPMQNDISGLNDQMMGYVFGIFAVGYALFQIPAGWFSDRVGPRRALTIVVIIWSVFTALTGAVYTAISLLVVRFLFGVGEAGAYPGATRALYRWLPAGERGLGQGIFHSGARVGAAFSLVLMPAIIDVIGWRWTFVANAAIGLVWAALWWFWYRDRPEDHPWTNAQEASLIDRGIREHESAGAKLPFVQVVTSANILLAMFQYASSNITFFISITWLRPYVEDRWGSSAANLTFIPLLVGAVALWVSGYLVTGLHRRGMPVLSRRIPAMVGYSLGAIGLLLCTQTSSAASAWPLIVCFSLAMFGVEMTLSSSWAFCMDIGGDRSGAVSGAMNMVGNLGAALSAVVFPYFVAHVTLPYFAAETETANSFFVFAAAMNTLAVCAWMFMNPLRQLVPLSPGAMRVRLCVFCGLMLLVVFALVYTTLLRG
jgi:MFS transporter, ACS family, glucarate transporter